MMPLVLLVAVFQDPAGGPLYRIVARLDESAGVISARAEVVLRNHEARPVSTLALHVPGAVHLTQVRLAGTLLPTEPAAPGLVRVAFPHALASSDSLILELAWTADPIRRHGREYGFASWQPRLPGFGRVLLSVDLPVDQVVSGTGVPLCGDPGWGTARRPAGGVITWQRSWYSASPPPATTAGGCHSSAAGRKVIVWYAENVAEIALALSPEFRYEEGNIFGKPMRAFYGPAEAHAWGAGTAVAHVETALAWLDEIFGPYPWPQATVVRTPQSPDTVATMQVWSGNATQLQLLRDFGRMYTAGLVSIRNPADAWLAEGLAGFQATWYLETVGLRRPTAQLEREVLDWDLDGVSAPVAQLPSAFRDSATAAAMISRRGELFFHELRSIVGDSALRVALHAYFDRYRFRDVDEAAFREVVERISKRELSDVFAQWLHATPLIDYGVGDVRMQRVGSEWHTLVNVDAHERGRFPVALWVIADTDTGMGQIDGRLAREQVTVVTTTRPRRVLLDPESQSHDWNALNNQRTFGFHLGRDRPTERYLDTYFTRPNRRDRVTIGWAPVIWRSDQDGWTLGLRWREDYLGRFELNEATLAAGTGWGIPEHRIAPHASLVLRNPVKMRATGWNGWVAGRWLDGRAGASIGVEWSRRRSVADAGPPALGLAMEWLTVHTHGYLDSLFYDDAGTLELTASARAAFAHRWRVRVTLGMAGGYQYRNAGAAPAIRDAAYGRVTAVATVRSDSAAGVGVGVRLYGGLTFSARDLVRQRRIYVAGADPYERMTSPFLRSRGSLLVRGGVRYHAPGGAGVRGLDPHIASARAYGVTVEAERAVWRRRAGLARRASLALFTDAALVDGGFGTGGQGPLVSVANAGAGLRIDHRVGATSFQTRLDLPLWISRPALAHDRGPGNRAIGWRWSFSFLPAY